MKWWQKNDKGRRFYKWDAYRIEMRYILVDNPEERGEPEVQNKTARTNPDRKTEQSMRQDDRIHVDPKDILPNTSVKQQQNPFRYNCRPAPTGRYEFAS